MTDGMALSAATARWAARILSGAILLFWGYFLIAHLTGEAGRSPRPLVWGDYVILAGVGVSLVGLALAWKWELVGAAITLIAVAVCAAVNWRVLVFPGTLVPLTATLFMFASQLSKLTQGGIAGRRAQG